MPSDPPGACLTTNSNAVNMAARLEGLLADTVALPTEAMGQRIVAALDAYQSGTPFDDITLLILRRRT